MPWYYSLVLRNRILKLRSGRLPIVLVVLIASWGAAVALGMGSLWSYTTRPGPAANPPRHWPADSQISRTAGIPALVMLAHPHCPCSRASIEELDRLMAHAGKAMDVSVLFTRPDGVADEWERSDLWTQAAAIPGVRVLRDDEGLEAARFGASTSGQVILYDGSGELRFSGGITSARGHSGGNLGGDAIVSLLTEGTADRDSTPVFGCSLFETELVRTQ